MCYSKATGQLARSCPFCSLTEVRPMILIVTSSTQANDKIKQCLIDRLRMSLSEADFARAINAEDALQFISSEDAGVDLVFVAARTFEEAVAFELELRSAHPEMPLIVVHGMDRIRNIPRPHSADVAFPLRSFCLQKAIGSVLKPAVLVKFVYLPSGISQAMAQGLVTA